MQAPRDENRIPALLGTSSADGTTPVTVFADPTTHRLLVSASATPSSGTSAPATTPTYVGQLFVDTTGKKLYFATGTSSSADWTIAN